MDNYTIIELFNECKSNSDFINVICKNFSGWIVTTSSKYSDEYVFLQDNWFRLCEKLNVPMRKILLVNETNNNSFNLLSDFLTTKGFCIRLYSQFNQCENCHSIIPCIDLWRNLKIQGRNIPEKWDKNCLSCINEIRN